jgi:hypothetical protein
LQHTHSNKDLLFGLKLNTFSLAFQLYVFKLLNLSRYKFVTVADTSTYDGTSTEKADVRPILK